MMQGMFTQSGAPTTTSHLDIKYILSILKGLPKIMNSQLYDDAMMVANQSEAR